MHYEALHFVSAIKSYAPEFFENVRVLDVGSGDINWNNRGLFTRCQYDGNDVIAAKNVTIVERTAALRFPDGYYDTIISTEAFEHDPEWNASIVNIMRMLKPGGMFLFTCATTGRPEHGTMRSFPTESYGTVGKLPEFMEYYRNLTPEDICSIPGFQDTFPSGVFYINAKACDLYFVGFKNDSRVLPEYEI